MKKVITKCEPYFLENKDFKTILISVMFPFKEELKDIAISYFIPSLLNTMNNAYPTEDLLQKAKKKLYILNSHIVSNSIGGLSYYTFSFVIPDLNSINEDCLDEQFKFMNDFIYNPLVTDGHFSDFEFDREKENLKLAISNAHKNLKPYHSIQLTKLIDENDILTKEILYHEDLIDDVTTTKLYDFYLKTIKNNTPAIFIMGNVDKERISNLCNKYLYNDNKKEQSFDLDLYRFFKPRSNIQDILENTNFKDSVLSIVYRTEDMKKEDIVYLNLVADLLNSLSSRLLSKKLRDELDLIYAGSAVAYTYQGLLQITNFINKNNVNLVKEKVIELMNDFHNLELIEPLLNNIKERNRNNLLRKLDNKNLIFEDFIISSLDLDITAEEYSVLVQNATAKGISDIVKRFKLDTIFFLEEGNNE